MTLPMVVFSQDISNSDRVDFIDEVRGIREEAKKLKGKATERPTEAS